MAKKIRLPDGTVALLVNRDTLSAEFETQEQRVGFFNKIRRKSTGKYYLRANAMLYDYVPEDTDVLVEVA